MKHRIQINLNNYNVNKNEKPLNINPFQVKPYERFMAF